MMVTLGRSQAKIIEDAHGDFPGGISAISSEKMY